MSRPPSLPDGYLACLSIDVIPASIRVIGSDDDAIIVAPGLRSVIANSY
jgi:hypothetical protein